MSSRTAKPPHAFVEDVREDGTVLPDTRVNAGANVGVKRSSKESLDGVLNDSVKIDEWSVAGDSGYSSKPATVASGGSDTKDARQERRVALRVDTSGHRQEERPRRDSRPEPPRRRSSSQAPPTRKTTLRRDYSPESPEYDPDCPQCNHHRGAHDHMNRSSRRVVSHETPIREKRSSMSSQARPQLVRNPSQRSSTTRPVSVDYTNRPPRDLPQFPPSSYYAPPPPVIPSSSPRTPYMMVPPQQLVQVTSIPYTPGPQVYVPPRPALQPLQRRATVTYGPPAPAPLPRVNYTQMPGQYCVPTAIPDRNVPQHYFSPSPVELVMDRQRAEEARQAYEARRAHEARQAMPPPSRPSMGARYATTTSASTYNYETTTARPREPPVHRSYDREPPSPVTIRPPSRTSASYTGSRRHSTAYPLSRRPTIDGHEDRHGLEAKVSDTEKYLHQSNTNPRLQLTPENVKKASNRVPSNAGSHVSKSSSGSGRKSSASHGTGGVTVMTDEYKISIGGETSDISLKKSDRGLRLTLGDDNKRSSRTFMIDDAPHHSERRERRPSRDDSAFDGRSQASSHSRRSDRSKR